MEFTPAVAPAGAVFYDGGAFPELRGNLLVGCLRGEGILRIGFEGQTPVSCERLLHYQYGRIRDVAVGPEGYIYFTTSQFDPPEGTPRPDYDFILRLVPRETAETGARLASAWQGPRAADPVLEPGTTNIAALTAFFCVPCHGPELRGGLQRGLLEGPWNYALDEAGLRRVIAGGLGDRGMPAFKDALQPEQVESLVRHLRGYQAKATKP
jgi:hypothetical protein